MGGSSSKSDSESGSSYSEDIWDTQGGALGSLYNQAKNLWGQSNSGMSGLIPGAVGGQQDIYNQSNPYWQDQMGGGVYQDMGLQNQLMSSLNQSMNNPSAMSEINAMIMGGEGNNYADAMKDSYVQDANRASDNMLSNLDARASASGMSGGSRHGTATAQGMQDINQNLQQQMAKTGFDTFDQDLDRKLQIAGMADQGTLARQQMMQDMLGQQQSTQNTGIMGGQNMQNMNMGQFNPYMMPWDAMSQYANVIGRPTVLGEGQMSGDASSKSAGGGVGSKG